MDVTTEVYVAQADFGHSVQIAIVQHCGGASSVAATDPNGHLTFTAVPTGAQMRPTLVIPREAAKKLLQGLLDIGTPTPTAGAIEGELKATKYHLEDLRRLIKIPKKPE